MMSSATNPKYCCTLLYCPPFMYSPNTVLYYHIYPPNTGLHYHIGSPLCTPTPQYYLTLSYLPSIYCLTLSYLPSLCTLQVLSYIGVPSLCTPQILLCAMLSEWQCPDCIVVWVTIAVLPGVWGVHMYLSSTILIHWWAWGSKQTL